MAQRQVSHKATVPSSTTGPGPGHQRPCAVLIVEDNPGDARLVAEYLRGCNQCDCTLTFARTLEEALEASGRQSFDVALLDLNLPDSANIDTARRWLSAGHCATTIVLSGVEDEQVASAAMALGAQDCLPKDGLTAPTLRRTLRHALERRAATLAAEQAHQDWHDTFQAIGQPTFLLAPDGAIEAANRAASRLLQVPIQEIVGRHCHDIMHNQACPPDGCPFKRALETGRWEPAEMECEALGRTFLVSCTPVLDDAGGLRRVIHIATDVTQLRKARERARVSDERLRNVVEHAPVGVHMYDLHGDGALVFTGANPTADQLLGIAHNQLIGRTIEEAFPGLRDTAIPDAYRTVIRTGEPFRIDQIAYKDERIDGAFDVHAFRTGPASLTVMFTDIAERLRSQEQLRESEERFRLLAEHAPAGIFVQTDGHFAYLNGAAMKVFGATPADRVVGTHVVERFAPEHHALVAQRIHTVNHLRSEVPLVEERAFRVDGTPIDVETSAVPFEYGDKHGALVFINDITMRKTAERALRDSEARLRTIFEESPVGIWEEDFSAVKARIDTILASGVKDVRAYLMAHPGVVQECAKLVRIIDMNQTSVNTLGARTKSELSHTITDYFTADSLPVFTEEIVALAGGAQRFESPITALNARAEARFLYLHLVVVPGYADTLERVLVTFSDQTERHLAQEQVHRLNMELEERVLQRTAQLEALNRELESFAYSISHDLRAPLRAMDGFSKAVLEEYGTTIDPTGRNLLERIRAGSQRMGDLIDDLLNLSRLSRQELQRRPVDITDIAGAIAADITGSEPQRTFEWTIEPGLVAQADAALVLVVIQNLFDNAAKFTRRQTVARISLTASRLPTSTEYCVRDNGAGFDMAYVDKLFAPFQRLHPVSEFEGNGIGLATVQRIVSRHGGAVRAKGLPGNGAAFFFTLGSAAGR